MLRISFAVRSRSFSTAAPSTIYRARRAKPDTPLISIEGATFYRNSALSDPDNRPLLENVFFYLPSKPKDSKPLEQWAVIGPDKTTLLEILRGQYFAVPPGTRRYPALDTPEIKARNPRLQHPEYAIQYVGFKNEGSQAIGGSRGAYLAARYESLREDTDLTLFQFLTGRTELNPLEDGAAQKGINENLLSSVVERLKLSQLLDMPVANLSNGQTRRAQIAKALLKEPVVLLLDEPFMGLDPTTTRSISNLLRELTTNSAPRLVLGLRPQDELPEWITHVVALGNKQQIIFTGSQAGFKEKLKLWREVRQLHGRRKDGKLKRGQKVAEALFENGVLDNDLLMDYGLTKLATRPAVKPAKKDGEPIIEMDGVQVRYGDRIVLGDWEQKVNGELKQGLHWKVRRGQRWAIIGANGSGKTTLLSLITSDHPQAYALPIKWFGRSRLPEPGQPGISVFDLQSRIGHSSPELHAFFPRQLSVRQALESAWADTFLSPPRLNTERDATVDLFLRKFKSELMPNTPPSSTKSQDSDVSIPLPKFFTSGLSQQSLEEDLTDVDWADNIRFGDLDIAQQRLVLFLRAIISRPDLIILDEAFSGMASSLRTKCFDFLEFGDAAFRSEYESKFPGLSEDQALIIVSHVPDELPRFLTHFMRLPSAVEIANESGSSSETMLPFAVGTTLHSHLKHSWETIWSVPQLVRSEAAKKGEPGDDAVVYDYVSPSSRKSGRSSSGKSRSKKKST